MHRAVSILFLLSLSLSLFSQQPAEQFRKQAESLDHREHSIRFIENKNQWEAEVLYKAELPGGALFLEETAFTYSFCDYTNLHEKYYHQSGPDGRSATVDCHAFKVHFEGANPSAVTADEPEAHFNNYFIGDDPSRWASEVRLFKQVRYHDLYPGTDLVLYSFHETVKYDLHLQAGADPADIQFRYDGQESIEIINGKLFIRTSVNEITEQKPFAYQIIDGREVEVPCNFVLRNQVLGFEFPDGYDRTKALVIDPTLVFGTYTGSTADNFGYTATYDNAGNLYAGGVAFGTGYPTTVGAFQTTFGGGGSGGQWTMNGGVDVSITKFNATGTALIYSTYLGGSANEQPHSMIVNNAGELMVYGRTYSSNFPTTAGAFDQTINGGADIFVTKFNAAGSGLVGSTYIGGSGEDGTNISTTFSPSSLKFNYGDDARGEIMIDSSGNIYVNSCTQSSNFPVTAGVVQGTFGGGTQDGTVFSFNPNLTTLNWATFIGGSANDAGYGIKLDTLNNIYITGGTESANFPTSAGAYDQTYGGAVDGYVMKLNNTATAMLASTFVGTNAYDQSYFLEIDNDQDVYIVGQTLGAFPVSAGVYSNAGGKQFVMKLDNNLSGAMFSTVFGSGAATVNLSPTAFLVDVCGFIYISGWGGTVNYQGNVNGMPLTNDAFQSTTDGSDMYLIILERDAVGLEYATYFGGATSSEHVDGGTSRFNRDLQVFQAVCAGCGGNSDFPTTPGAWSNTNNAFNCNLGAFKFQFNPQDIVSAFNFTQTGGCAPYTVNFQNNSQGGLQYFWDFGDGVTDTAFAPSHVYTVADTYTVKLVVVDSNSCNIADSVTQQMIIFAAPNPSVVGGGTICAGGNVQLQASGGTWYQWYPSTGLSNDTIANPIASPTQTTTYTVVVTNPGGCQDSAQVTVTVSNFAAEAGPPASFCEGTGGVQLFGSSLGGQAPFWYQWWCDSSQTWCGLDSVYDNDPIALPTGTTMYYLQVTDANGCLSAIDSVLVTVEPVPIVDAGPDQWICADSAPGAFLYGSVINDTAATGPYTWTWSPPTGLNNPNIQQPYARPDTTTTYSLSVTSANGCTSHFQDTTQTVTVHVYPLPVADAGPDIDLCFADTVMLIGKGFNAGPGYAYEWSPGAGLTDSSVANPIASPVLTTEYILTVWSNGCPSYGDTMVVFVHDQPTVDAGPDRDMCLTDVILLDAQASGAANDTSFGFNWWPGDGIVSADTIEDILVSPDSTQWYYVTSVSNWGCESPVDSALVTVRPTPVAEAGQPLTLCFGDSLRMQGSWSTLTSGPLTDSTQLQYHWSPAADFSDPNITDPWAYPDSTMWFYFTVDYQICSTTDSVLVTVVPDLGLSVSADTTTICGGDSVRLNASGGFGSASFTWMPSTGLSDPASANPMAAPSDTTTYMLVISEIGCSDTMSITLNVIPSPEMAFVNSSPEGCVPLTVNFTESSTNTQLYMWNFGDGSPVVNTLSASHTYTTPGVYPVYLTGMNTGGCSDSSNVLWVTVHDTAAADFDANPGIPAEVYLPGAQISFNDLSVNATSWHWELGDGSSSDERDPVHEYSAPGEYFVTLIVENAAGCISSVTKGPIIVMAPDLKIPNVFTPNGDGINDEFFIYYTGSQPFLFNVYDRWGKQLFTTTNKNEGWDGSAASGTEMPEGVYFYTVSIGGKDYSGYVTLMR